MNRLFGSRKDATPRAERPERTSDPAPRDPVPVGPATDKLTDTQEILEKREAHVLRLIAGEVEQARTATAAGRKRDALECIKRKRLHEKELERLSTQRLNLLNTSLNLQQLKITGLVHDANLAGAAAMEREIARHGGVAGVDKIQDRLEDALADSADIFEASTRLMGGAADFDDQELLDEIEQLELEDQIMRTDVAPARGAASSSGAASQEVPEFASVPRTVPAVSSGKRAVARAHEEEERELAQLAATMEMEGAMPMPMRAVSCF